MGRKKRHRGHYCWACGRVRANERFSGGGHNVHVCRDCQKLGSEELDYRQAARNVDRCLSFGGSGILRKHRKAFDRFLNHDNPRVKEYAQRIKLEIDDNRKAWRAAIEADERMAIEYSEAIGAPDDLESDHAEKPF